MGSYQLTMTPEYIKDWDINHALRELFQNGIDRKNEDPLCTFSYIYDEVRGILLLQNRHTKLHKRTLLLGVTIKDGKSTIGKYGEGYKLALLVLLRNGCRITIENGDEIWEPKIVKSRVFDSELIQINTSKGKDKQADSLRYIITGISKAAYEEYKEYCLLFHSYGPIECKQGDILIEEKYKGKVFCNSLYVCNVDGLEYGYNIKPKYIELDRDRKKVDTFNLLWETSRMWASISNTDMVSKLISKNASDVEYYIYHKNVNNELYNEVSKLQYDEFIKTHGTNAVVCKNKEEMDLIRAKYKNLVPVIVPEKVYEIIHGYGGKINNDFVKRNENTPENWIKNWIKEYNGQTIIDSTSIDYTGQNTYAGDVLLEEAKKWAIK